MHSTVPRADRNLRVLRGLAVGGWLVITVAVWGSFLVWVMRGLPALPLSFGRGPGYVSLGMLAFVYGTVGALLAARRPRNVIGWLFMITGAILSLVCPITLAVSEAVHTFRPLPGATVVLAWIVSAVTAPFAAGTAFGVAVIFPGGRPRGPWMWLVVLQSVAGIAVAAASALNPAGVIWYPTLPNPLPMAEGFTWPILSVRIAAVTLSVVSMLAVAASLPIRYQRSDPVLRHQLRWIIAAIAILPPTVAPLFVARYIVGADQALGEGLMVLASVGGCAFPLAVAIAIMRHHLFGIERLVERALVYVPLMGMLGGLYAASLALFQRAFVAVTGYTSDASIVLSTLILASAFTPMRQALERAVDRRFKAGSGPSPSAAIPLPTAAGADRIGVPPVAADGARGQATGSASLAGDPTVAAITAVAERLARIEERMARLEAGVVPATEPDALAGARPVIAGPAHLPSDQPAQQEADTDVVADLLGDEGPLVPALEPRTAS